MLLELFACCWSVVRLGRERVVLHVTVRFGMPSLEEKASYACTAHEHRCNRNGVHACGAVRESRGTWLVESARDTAATRLTNGHTVSSHSIHDRHTHDVPIWMTVLRGAVVSVWRVARMGPQRAQPLEHHACVSWTAVVTARALWCPHGTYRAQNSGLCGLSR